MLVIYRIDKEQGTAIAFFPQEPYDFTGEALVSYEHVGQHGAASRAYYRENTREAKSDDEFNLITELHSEIRGVYYDEDLVIVTRFTDAMDTARRNRARSRAQQLHAPA